MSPQGPQYDPSLICAIARTGNIAFDRRAKRDSVNLGYLQDDVVSCLCNIKYDDYYKTIPVELDNGTKVLFDVFKLHCTNSQDTDDGLYVKLRISAASWLTIGSFKLE